MNINCERLQDQYSDYFEHLLSPNEVETFEHHIASCDDCRADYHTFATMFQFLDRVEVDEVEAPSGLRADILSVIAQRPAAKIFNMRDWLGALVTKPQTVWGVGLAAAACMIVAIVIGLQVPHHQSIYNGPTEGNFGPGATSGMTPAATPLLQNVTLKEGTGGLDYEVFTLHLPSNVQSSANVSAYVLQDGDPVADKTLETDTDKATPAWSGSLAPNTSLSLPVSVTSDLPAGTSLNLLLDWSTSTTSGREVAFVPVTPAASSISAVPAGTSFYDSVKTIAGEYQQTIVADSSALAALTPNMQFGATTGTELNANDALNAVLSNDGFKVTEQQGGYYLISHS